MSIKPQGSTLSWTTGAGTCVTTVLDCKCDYNYEFFQRMEFNHERLQQALETSGASAVFDYLLGGFKSQYLSLCSPGTTVRPITPDDSDYNNEYKAFQIKKYDIIGDDNETADVQLLYAAYIASKTLLQEFENHQQAARSNISITDLIAMQSDSLSYLTSTANSVAGSLLQGTSSESNILITRFQPSVEFAIEQEDSSFDVMQSFVAEIQVRTIVNATVSAL